MLARYACSHADGASGLSERLGAMSTHPLLLRSKEMYEDVGILGSRVPHRVGGSGVAMRALARSEILELSTQVVIPLPGKPRHITLTRVVGLVAGRALEVIGLLPAKRNFRRVRLKRGAEWLLRSKVIRNVTHVFGAHTGSVGRHVSAEPPLILERL